ncbi:MAG: nucleoside triphosphate pyrophosphohydrolase [Candidatus Eisenbacteria bacterium]|nr:nucleoside triphosphate pyrophosphohydrolase [Candidatus Eisenbacteria bacterium]
MESQASYDWEGLRRLCRRLRARGGCNWDRQQTIESLTPYLLEETHEVLEAAAEGSDARIVEELGDLLYLIVFAVTIAEEEGRFTFRDIAGTISRKLIARHPHVFRSGERDLDFENVRQQWESIKQAEKARRGDTRDTLAPGATGVPALLLAYRVQEKAASFGFDWPDARAVVAKVGEEYTELQAAFAGTPHPSEPTDVPPHGPQVSARASVEEETGDLLFTAVNLARHLRADPDRLLRQSVAKFRQRFARMEARLSAEGLSLSDADLATMERAWQAAKADEG